MHQNPFSVGATPGPVVGWGGGRPFPILFPIWRFDLAAFGAFPSRRLWRLHLRAYTAPRFSADLDPNVINPGAAPARIIYLRNCYGRPLSVA